MCPPPTRSPPARYSERYGGGRHHPGRDRARYLIGRRAVQGAVGRAASRGGGPEAHRHGMSVLQRPAEDRKAAGSTADPGETGPAGRRDAGGHSWVQRPPPFPAQKRRFSWELCSDNSINPRPGGAPGHLRPGGRGEGQMTPPSSLKIKKDKKAREKLSIALNQYLHSKVFSYFFFCSRQY